MDVIVGYHFLCLAGAATLVWVRRTGFGAEVATVALGAYILGWTVFLFLNLTGKVWQLFVDEPGSLWDAIKMSLA